MSVERTREIDPDPGTMTSPWPDSATAELALLVRWWHRFDKQQRGMQTANQPEALVEVVQKVERMYRRRVQKALKAHPLWDFLEDKPGLRGPYVAWLIARIRDPRRFPGQKCEAGHYLPAIYEVGAPCPIENRFESESDAGRCGVPIQPRRRGTGVRSLWHYFGLHVVDGKRARVQKGKKATWVTEAGGILLGPQGVADQIIRHRPEPYRGIYEQHKERLTVTRGAAEVTAESDVGDGRPRTPEGAEAEDRRESDVGDGLRPFEIETRARTIAVKAFVGDLLMEWKRRV